MKPQGGKRQLFGPAFLLASALLVAGYSAHAQVTGDPPTISTQSLPSTVVGVPYSQFLTATGGKPPYLWSILSGSLPAGLDLNPLAGAVSGTATTAGAFDFTVQLSDLTFAVSTKQLRIIVVSSPLVITTASPLPNGFVSTPYTQTLAAAGGAPPDTWSIVAGALPPGVTLDSSSGAISGSPSAAGTYAFTTQVSDSTKASVAKDFKLGVFVAGLTIQTASALPAATVGSSYSQSLSSAGGAPPFTWSVVSGSLPVGIALNRVSGVLSGTPTDPGTFAFTVQVSDGVSAISSKAFFLTVNPGPLLIFTVSPVAPGVSGTPYLSGIIAVGGAPPYGWAVSAGSLPPGLALSASNGSIFGTPTDSGAFTFTVKVTDSAGATASREFRLTIEQGILVTAIVNAASLQLGAIAPGTLLSIFGSGMGFETGASFALDASQQIATALADTRVLFDGVPAPVLFSQARQVNAIAPAAIAGKTGSDVQVEFKGARSRSFRVLVAESAPALLTQDASGRGQGAILNEDGSINSAANPASAGSVVVLYGTGGGLTDPPSVDGKITASPLPKPRLPVSVTIGGVQAEILYAGAAPGLVAGMLQINARIPAAIQPGNGVPVLLTIGSASSRPGVTLAVH